LGLLGPLWSKLYEQRDIMGGNGDTPGTKHPEEPRMGGIPEQVGGGKPDNDDDKDCKMDQEAAERRFAELGAAAAWISFVSTLDDPLLSHPSHRPGRIAMRMKLRNGVRHDIDLHQ
jgi:hypothetical protein